MSDHTPLPWTVSEQYLGAPDGGYLPIASAYHSYVTDKGGKYHEIACANAVHIVRSVNAVPALVKALEDIQSRLAGPANAKSYDITQIVEVALADYRKV